MHTVGEFVQLMVIHEALENKIICWSGIDWTKLTVATLPNDTDAYIQQQHSTQHAPLCPHLKTYYQCRQDTRAKLSWLYLGAYNQR